MAEFLTTHGTASRIEEIMINAKKEIYLVSPFLQISRTFYQRLIEASDFGVEIKIIYGKNELKSNEWNSLVDIPKLELYYLDNLHAKCYFNESKMVITSMNMYEFSEKNNREMGVLVDIKNDLELYDSAKRETLSIIKLAERKNLNTKQDHKEIRKNYNGITNSEINQTTLKSKAFKIHLSSLHVYLADRYTNNKMSFEGNYLFSRTLIRPFYTKITTTSILLTSTNPYLSNELINNISNKLSVLTNYNFSIKIPSREDSIYSWEISNFQSLDDFGNVISEINKMGNLVLT